MAPLLAGNCINFKKKFIEIVSLWIQREAYQMGWQKCRNLHQSDSFLPHCRHIHSVHEGTSCWYIKYLCRHKIFFSLYSSHSSLIYISVRTINLEITCASLCICASAATWFYFVFMAFWTYIIFLSSASFSSSRLHAASNIRKHLASLASCFSSNDAFQRNCFSRAKPASSGALFHLRGIFFIISVILLCIYINCSWTLLLLLYIFLHIESEWRKEIPPCFDGTIPHRQYSAFFFVFFCVKCAIIWLKNAVLSRAKKIYDRIFMH